MLFYYQLPPFFPLQWLFLFRKSFIVLFLMFLRLITWTANFLSSVHFNFPILRLKFRMTGSTTIRTPTTSDIQYSHPTLLNLHIINKYDKSKIHNSFFQFLLNHKWCTKRILFNCLIRLFFIKCIICSWQSEIPEISHICDAPLPFLVLTI